MTELTEREFEVGEYTFELIHLDRVGDETDEYAIIEVIYDDNGDIDSDVIGSIGADATLEEAKEMAEEYVRTYKSVNKGKDNMRSDTMDAETIRHKRLEKMKKELDEVAPIEPKKEIVEDEDEDKKEGDCKDCRKRKIADAKKDIGKCKCKDKPGCHRDSNGRCRDKNDNPCWANDAKGERQSSTRDSGSKPSNRNRTRSHKTVRKCILTYRAYENSSSVMKSNPTQMFVKSFEPLFVDSFISKGYRDLTKSVNFAVHQCMSLLKSDSHVNKARLSSIDTDKAVRMLVKSIRKAESILPIDADEQQAQIEPAGKKDVLPADADDMEDEVEEEPKSEEVLPADADEQEEQIQAGKKKSSRKGMRKSKKSLKKAMLTVRVPLPNSVQIDDKEFLAEEDEEYDIVFYRWNDYDGDMDNDMEFAIWMNDEYNAVVRLTVGDEVIDEVLTPLPEIEDRMRTLYNAYMNIKALDKSARKSRKSLRKEDKTPIKDDDVVEIEEEDGEKVVEIESKEEHDKEVEEGKESEDDNLNARRVKGVRKAEMPDADDQQDDVESKAKAKDVLPEEANDQEDDGESAPKNEDALPEEANEQQDVKQSRRKSLKRGVRKYSVTNGGSEKYDGRQNYGQSPMMREAIDNHFKGKPEKDSAEEELVKSFNQRISAIQGQRRNPSISKSSVPKVHGRH